MRTTSLIKKKSLVLVHGVFDESVFKKFTKTEQYFILEGRPDLAASKATLKFLSSKRITPTIVTDNVAGFLFYNGLVKEVRLSYQYHDSSGALCDIGAVILGVLGRTHGVPVKIFPGKLRKHFLAPQEELLRFNGKSVVSHTTRVYAPLVEWLSNDYITQRNQVRPYSDQTT